MSLPINFQWLNTIGVLPKMVAEGIKLLGIKEIPGAASNPKILEFAREIGVSAIYKNDDISWCALAHNAVAKRAGKAIYGYSDQWDLLRALKFLMNGVSINKDDWEVIDLDKAVLGDSLIFQRPEGGHIGTYIGENATHFYVMGGNQSNMYSFTRVAKTRLVGVRRPKYKIARPESAVKYFLNDTGIPVTSNEA